MNQTPPILFLIYNRPKTTNHVFERIRKAQPKQLLIAADGPRKDNINDIELCIQTRAIIQKVDWQCEVKTLFRTENLGCAKAISSAITWFFEHVEEGIILEDDCSPHPSFFSFCSIMLEKYRNEPQVWQIAGTNYLFGESPKDYEYQYYFSAYSAIWGWATWRRAWSYFNLNISNRDDNYKNILKKRIPNKDMQHWLLNLYDALEEKNIDTWDIQWNYHFHFRNGLCLTPTNNLIQNKGIYGTHFSFRTPFHNMPIKPIQLNNLLLLKENIPLSIQYQIDEIAFKNILHRKLSLSMCLLRKIETFFS